MANFNKVILLGNVTRDLELRYTPKGSAVTEVGLAINRQYSLDNGERKEETTFVDVTLWGRTAEVAAEYLRKGRPVFIEGRLQLDTWEDKQTGQRRSKLRVVGETMQLLGGPGGGGGGGSARQEGGGGYSTSQSGDSESRSEPSRGGSAPSMRDMPSDDDEDIPF